MNDSPSSSESQCESGSAYLVDREVVAAEVEVGLEGPACGGLEGEYRM